MAVIGDQIPLASVDLTSGHPHIKAGTLIGLGVTAARRAKTAPDIPTIAEGGVPGFDGSSGFIGIFAPPGTPAPRIRQLSTEIAAIIAKPDVQSKIALLSVEPAYEDEATFGQVAGCGLRQVERAVQDLAGGELDHGLLRAGFRHRIRSQARRRLHVRSSLAPTTSTRSSPKRAASPPM